MPLKIITLLLTIASFAMADEPRFQSKPADKLTVVSPDKSVKLTVSLERFDRDKILQVDKGEDKPHELWIGDRKLPFPFLHNHATLVKSFTLTIDGKDIPIPARFWSDVTGVELHKVVTAKPVKTEEDAFDFYEYTTTIPRPQVSRSADGGTVLITWGRPEE